VRGRALGENRMTENDEKSKVYRISHMTDPRQMVPTAVELTWQALKHLLQRSSEKRKEKEGPGLVPCQFVKGEGRSKKTKGKVDAWRQVHLTKPADIMCLDIEDHNFGTDDKVALVKTISDVAPGTTMAIYTTYSHGLPGKWKPGHPRLRVIIPLKRGVDADEYKLLYEWFERVLPGVDPNCKDITHIAYLPRMKAPGAKLDPWIHNIHGAELDPDALPGGTSTEILKTEAEEGRQAQAERMGKFAQRQSLKGEQLQELLDHVDGFDDRERWLKVAMALRSYAIEGHIAEQEAFELWDKWSQQSSKYEQSTQGKTWDSLGRETGEKITIGTLYHYAMEGGWKPPKRKPWRYGSDNEIAQFLLNEYLVVRERGGLIPSVKIGPYLEEGKSVSPIPTAMEQSEAGDFFRRICAEASLRFHAGCLWRYCVDAGLWIEFTLSQLSKVMNELEGHPIRAGKGGQTKPFVVSTSKIKNVYSLLQLLCKAKADAFPKMTSIAAANGVLAVDKNDVLMFFEGRRTPMATFCRYRIPYIYDPYVPADSSLWREFVYSCWRGDGWDEVDHMEREQALAIYCGAALFHDIGKIQKAVVLVGPGGGGKSTFLHVIRSLFDPSFVSSIPPQMMGTKHSNLPLSTAVINVVADVDRRDFTETGSLKQAVSGDNMAFERKYGDAFSVPVKCGHLFACNELPHSGDQGVGFWDRWLPISFPKSLRGTDQQDPNLLDKIMQSGMPGVFCWVVRGYLLYIGFRKLQDEYQIKVPESSKALLSEWKTDSCPVRDFVKTMCDDAPSMEDGNSLDLLFSQFREWSSLHRRGQHLASNTFAKRLSAMGYDSVRIQRNGTRRRYYPLRFNSQYLTTDKPPSLTLLPSWDDDGYE
jgi:phage/plasmid-associated DNA primase